MWDNNSIKELINPTDTVLDLGCGNKDSFAGVKCEKYVGVDIWRNAKADIVHDLRETPYPFNDKSFDVVTALDCIEHLEREEGSNMLSEMKRIAKRLIVIFTPEEFRDNLSNVNTPGLWSTGNIHNIHKSLWTVEDFKGWDFIKYTDPGYIFCSLKLDDNSINKDQFYSPCVGEGNNENYPTTNANGGYNLVESYMKSTAQPLNSSIKRAKRLLIFCSSWMYSMPEIEGWEVYCNVQESDPRFSSSENKFGDRYIKAIHEIKPDFVLAVNVGCSEQLFDRMEKPRQYGTKYITWSTDSYRHTQRALTSDLHLSSIPDATMDNEKDNFVPLFFDIDYPILSLNKRRYLYGIHCRVYGMEGQYRQNQIQKLMKILKSGFYINQKNMHPLDYIKEVSTFKFGINIPTYHDGLPNFRSFELGSLGVMPISDSNNRRVLEELFEENILIYDEPSEIPELLKKYDPYKLKQFYNDKHSLKERLNYIFRKFFDLKFEASSSNNSGGKIVSYRPVANKETEHASNYVLNNPRKRKILHIIYCLGGGGAPGAMIAVAKHSSLFGNFQHRVASLLPVDPNALRYAEEAGMSVLMPQNKNELLSEIENADIVHVHWWNNPELYEVLRSELPEMRMLIWFHVAGDKAPQIITQELVDFADFALACSPYTYQCQAIMNLPPEVRFNKAGMVYGAADFDRLKGIEPRQHDGFNVGYVGLATPYKMHPNYIPMSASIDIPNVRFIVCGSISDIYERQARQLGVAERFDFRGHVSDIKSVFEQFDVFGYPLSIHVAAECGVQEAMYAGVPPVVFPAGGISKLVINDYTGLVVHSELEYKQAIEYLYHHPEERKRMGRNAREYAKQVFGGENAAEKLNLIYERMMQSPKRKRTWGRIPELTTLNHFKDLSGAEKFIQSLGNAPEAQDFIVSMTSSDIQDLFHVEKKISQSTGYLYWENAGGIHHYRNYYRDDAYLFLWAGLVYQNLEEHLNAVSDFQSAINLGIKHWRLYWYLAQSAEKAGNLKLAKKSVNSVLEAEPEFNDAQEMSKRIEEIETEMEFTPERFSTACPHCSEILYVDRKGRWQCPCCKNDFMV